MIGLIKRIFEEEKIRGGIAVNLFSGVTQRLSVPDSESLEHREPFTDDELTRILSAIKEVFVLPNDEPCV